MRKEKGGLRHEVYQACLDHLWDCSVCCYHADNCDSFDAHAVYVTQGGSNPLITCHSNEQLDVSYTYMGTSMPYYEWLHYNE